MNLSRSQGYLTLLSVTALLALTACPREEEPVYPQQQYPQQQYPQQQYPQQQYPQQPAPAYTQPAPTATAPAPGTAGAGQPASVIPGVVKMPDGTCQWTPPSLDPNTPAQPVAVPCPPM
jgi:hypothetical protein